jgi:hypothetical protein
METRRQTLSDCDSCGRTTAATYFPQCNTTASLTPGATTSCFIATETAYSKGTQIDYRFGFCSCGFSASPVETITQPFHTIARHTTTSPCSATLQPFMIGPRQLTGIFASLFTTTEHPDSTPIVHLSCIRHPQYSSQFTSCGTRRTVYGQISSDTQLDRPTLHYLVRELQARLW